MDNDGILSCIGTDIKDVFILDINESDCEDIINNLGDDRNYYTTCQDVTGDNIKNIQIPTILGDLEKRIKYSIDLCSGELNEESKDVGIYVGSEEIDSILYSSFNYTKVVLDDNIRSFIFDSRADSQTITDTLRVATTIARKGRKGSPVGALFVIGDEDEVLNRSRPLNYNPFSGTDARIGDEVVSASIGEYAKLDGAFIISDAGQIISANRYLEPKVHDADVPSGLGARHMAASGITNATDAVAIVVSESDQKIRGFVDGEIVISTDPGELDYVV